MRRFYVLTYCYIRTVGGVVNFASRWNRMGKPNITAYNAVVPHHRAPPQNGGAGVNNYVAADIGVTLYAFNGITLIVKLKASCAQRNTLIQLNMVLYGAGFTDNHPCAVVDKEILPYLRTGMNVYAG